jgi:hypothetical protein
LFVRRCRLLARLLSLLTAFLAVQQLALHEGNL